MAGELRVTTSAVYNTMGLVFPASGGTGYAGSVSAADRNVLDNFKSPGATAKLEIRSRCHSKDFFSYSSVNGNTEVHSSCVNTEARSNSSGRPGRRYLAAVGSARRPHGSRGVADPIARDAVRGV